MTIITGIFRNGRVALDGPVPDWAEGSAVTVTKPESVTDHIDITGDSPEAIAAWIAWFDKLHALLGESTFPEELDRVLAVSKAEEMMLWEQQCK